MPIYDGVDVSRFQGVINWANVAAVEDFAIIKASGGDDGLYTDSKFAANQVGVRGTALKHGYYHFGSLGLNDAATEAAYFVAAVGALQAGEIMVLDAESEAGAGIILSQSSVAWCKTFLDTVAAAVGFKPLIYMSQSFSYSIDWTDVASADYPLWVANTSLPPTGINLYVGAWSDLGKGYPIHQYSSFGSVSGISGNVDKDGFFVDASSTLDKWDTYGLAGSSTSSGSTNVPNITNTASGTTSSSYTQANPQSLITPDEGNDQVIYSVTTTDATLTTGSHSAFYEIPTPIGQYAYPIGMFSYDGGVTWNDFGFTLPIATTYASVQPGVQIQPSVDASGNIFFNGVNNTAGTVTLILRVALLASYAPGPVPVPATLTQNTSYTNDARPLPSPTFLNFFLPPYSSYRRIASDTVSGTGDHTVAHGQSAVPNFMFWVNVGGFITMNAIGWQSTGSLGVLGIHMDSTNIVFHVDAGTYNNCYYRTYKDN